MRTLAAATFISIAAIAPASGDTSLASLIEITASADNADVQADLLEGAREGLRGGRDIEPPEGWADLYMAIRSSDNGRLRAVGEDLARVFGDREVWVRTFVLLKDGTAPPAERTAALHSLIEQSHPKVAAELPILLDDPGMRLAAIRAMGKVEVANTPKLLLGRYKKLNQGERLAAVQTLASRRQFAWPLGHAIRDGRVPRADVPAYVRRQIVGLIGRGSIPEIDDVPDLPEDKARKIATWKKRLSPKKIALADPAEGRAVFARTCAICHKLFAEGNAIGPDLTGSNRADLDYILDNIINPSGDVAEGYQLIVLTLNDGRVIAGNIVDENDRQIVIHTVAEKITLAKDDVAKREVSPASMMPEGLIDTLKESEVRDLIAYLRAESQVAMPPSEP